MKRNKSFALFLIEQFRTKFSDYFVDFHANLCYNQPK
jgi:hypothetical protein